MFLGFEITNTHRRRKEAGEHVPPPSPPLESYPGKSGIYPCKFENEDLF